MAGLKAGLKALGLEESRDVTFDIRFTRGKLEEAPPAAAALVKGGADLIVVQTEQPARAVKEATQTIPIVFVEVGDPVAAGLVTSIPRPGGSITGISSLATELTPKRLEMLRRCSPGVRRVWAVYYTDDLSSAKAARKAQEVASLLKLEVVVRAVRKPEELVGYLKTLRSGDALLSPPAVTMNIPSVILDLERMSRWPALFYNTFWRGGCPGFVRLRPACRGCPSRTARREDPARGAAPGSAGGGCEQDRVSDQLEDRAEPGDNHSSHNLVRANRVIE